MKQQIQKVILYSFLLDFQQVMALRGRCSRDVQKSSYYVWYLGCRKTTGVEEMAKSMDILMEREKHWGDPYKVTLQVRFRFVCSYQLV